MDIPRGMFLKNIFGKKESASQPLPVPPGASYLDRVTTFWEWFAANADALDAMVTMPGRQEEVLALMNATVAVLSPAGLDWCFDRGANGAKHSFILSSGGNPHRRQLVDFWLDKAPEIPGWSFFSAKQPAEDLGSFSINVGDTQFRPAETWVTPEYDEDSDRFNLWVWHPGFVSQRDQGSAIAFLLLDAALGEDMVAAVVGGVASRADRLQTAMPLTELRGFMDAEVIRREWQKRIGGQHIVQAELPELLAAPYDFAEFVTHVPELVTEMVRGELVEHDPLEASGAAYYFVRLPRDASMAGRMESLRNALCDGLFDQGIGQRIGFGVGPEAFFQFVTAFDPPSVLSFMSRLLSAHQVPAGTAIYPCTHVYGAAPVTVV